MKYQDYVKYKVEPFEIVDNISIIQVMESMAKISFQGRNLGRAYQIWKKALQENTTIFFGLAGAMIPAGMRKIIIYLIKNRLIDCLVSTGANIFHDCHEALGYYHYQGTHQVDDTELRQLKLDRIYDTLVSDEEFEVTDNYIADFAKELKHRPYTTREFLYELGKSLVGQKQEGILSVAAQGKVPIYCPAISDSSIGMALAMDKKPVSERFLFDIIGDVDEPARIALASHQTAVIYLGGGTPKNFIQQIEVTTHLMKYPNRLGHRYAVQLTVDAPHWGGLSGCTFEEAQSWGKIAIDSEKTMVFCDATIGLPLLVSALAESKAYKKRPVIPQFEMGRELKINE